MPACELHRVLTTKAKKPGVQASSCAHFAAAGSLLMAMVISSVMTDKSQRVLLHKQPTHVAVLEIHPAAG